MPSPTSLRAAGWGVLRDISRHGEGELVDFWIYAAEIGCAATAGTLAGQILDGPDAERPVNPRIYEWINRYIGLGALGLMLAAFYWYGLWPGLGAIAVGILIGAVLYSFAGRLIPKIAASFLYAVATVVLLVVHMFLYKGG